MDSRHVGIGPASMVEGDQIWLLAGSSVPVVLRQRGSGRAMLIGEAYVDGLMYGEIWSMSDTKLEQVVLE